MTPEGFLELEDVLQIHANQLRLYGGADGVRDPGLLESALAMPLAGFGGQLFHPTMFEQAAAYVFHLVKNHPFIDGNKRTGIATALVFLDLNGHDVVATTVELVDLVLGVAEGRTDKVGITAFLRGHTQLKG